MTTTDSDPGTEAEAMAGAAINPDPNAALSDIERWAQAAAWSHRAALDPVETIMWRAEKHPALSSTSCLVIVLDKAPAWKRFRDAHEWGTSLVHRLRQRLVESSVSSAPPVWIDDRHFSLDYHVRRQPVGGERTMDDVMEAASQFALRPFDRERPLWEGVLLTDLADGRAAYVIKFHHALADSLGTVQLLSMLMSRTRKHTADKPTSLPSTPDRSAEPTVAPTGLLDDLAALPTLATKVARRGLLSALRPRETVGESLRYAASLRRLLSPAPTAGSDLLASRDGYSWRFVTVSAPLSELRAAGQSMGGSLQDTFIAALLGGLRKYHHQYGERVEELPVSIRVSLDRADDPMSGNRFAGAMIAAPVGLVDPADRIAAVRGEILSLHTERALDAFAAFAPWAHRLPGEVVTAILEAGATADVSAVTTAGPTKVSYLAGGKVEGIYQFGPLPGVAVAASLVTYGDRACIGVNVDALAVADLAVFTDCLREGLDEVLDLAR